MSKRMVPVVSRTKGTTIVKEADGGVQRMRCTKCQNLATPAVTPSGKQVIACPVCGAQMTETRI